MALYFVEVLGGPVFPESQSAYWKIKHGIDEGRYSGEQEQWATWYVTLPKLEIMRIIADSHRGTTYETRGEYLGHLFDKYQRLLEFMKSLPEDGFFTVRIDCDD